MSLREYVASLKYMVIDKEKKVSFYQSLRKIAIDIKVDSSTISRNIKESGNGYCTSKHNNQEYYIKRLL